MYCKNCGTQIDDNAVICPNCMYRNEPLNPGYGYNNQNYLSNNSETPIARYSWNSVMPVWLISGIVALLACFVFLATSYMYLEKDSIPPYIFVLLIFLVIYVYLSFYIVIANYGLYFKLYNNRLEMKCRCSGTKGKTDCTILLNEIQAVSVNNKIVVITAKNNHYTFVTKNRQQSNLVKSKIEQSRNPQQEYTVF
ncbi:MAG: zinc-ribbon domain-containing protein [Ruminococcus sp.]